MTPKEKARKLFDKYQIAGSQWYVDTTKNYALIAVEELIQQCWDYREIDLEKSCDYWKEVKQEIEKL